MIGLRPHSSLLLPQKGLEKNHKIPDSEMIAPARHSGRLNSPRTIKGKTANIMVWPMPMNISVT